MMGYAKILVLQGLLMGDTDYITSCYHMMVEARVAKVEAQALSSMAMKRRASITGASS